MNYLTVIVLIAIPAASSAYLCSLHYCLHNHHCCSFNCTVQGCVCLPDGKECKIGSACCSKICHKTDSKRKLGTCQQFEGTSQSPTTSIAISTTPGAASTSAAAVITTAATQTTAGSSTASKLQTSTNSQTTTDGQTTSSAGVTAPPSTPTTTSDGSNTIPAFKPLR